MIQNQYKKSALTQVAQATTLDVEGLASLIIELTGTFVGTVIFEYSINSVDWYTLTVNVLASESTATGATAVGVWTVPIAGFKLVRVRCTAFTSGAINAAIRAIISGSGSAGVGTGSGGTVNPVVASISTEVTRPSDTTAYAALDTVSDSTSAPTVLTFTGIGRIITGTGYIVKAQLSTDQKTNTARFRLHLFNAAPTAINDNSPYLTLYANIANRIGTIDFPAAATEDPTNSTQSTAILTPGSGNLPLAFTTIADANLYGILETLDAFTPASGQKITIKLGVDQN